MRLCCQWEDQVRYLRNLPNYQMWESSSSSTSALDTVASNFEDYLADITDQADSKD